MDVKTQLFNLISNPSREIRISTIRVILELKLKDQALVKVLCEQLRKEQDPTVGDALLEIPIRNPAQGYLKCLLELLKRPQFNKSKISNAIAALGDGALNMIEKNLKQANPDERRLLLSVAANFPGARAPQLLLDSLMLDPKNVDWLKYGCHWINHCVINLADKDRSILVANIVKRLEKKLSAKQFDTLFNSYVMLLSQLAGNSDILNIWLKVIHHKNLSVFALRHALIGISRSVNTVKKINNEELVREVVQYVEHEDVMNVARLAIEVLQRVKIPGSYHAKFNELTKSKNTTVQSFAVSKLGDFDSKAARKNVETLIEYLNSNDQRMREASRASLEKMSAAGPKLLSILFKNINTESIDLWLNILKHHRRLFTGRINRKLILYLNPKQKNSSGALSARNAFKVLRTIDPDYLYRESMKIFKLLKSKGKWVEAAGFLNYFESGFLYSNEIKFQHAICLIKCVKKPDFKNMPPELAKGLLTIQSLIKSNRDATIELLFKERALTLEDCYFLGNYFYDSSYDLREAGKLILEKLAKNKSSSKLRKLSIQRLGLKV